MGQDSFAVSTRVPTKVPRLSINIVVVKGQPNAYDATYSFDVLDADGAIMDVRDGDLIPHLSTSEINGLKALMDSLISQAQGALG
jgi:hypothetical protein